MNLYSISLKRCGQAFSKGLLPRLTMVFLIITLALGITPTHAQVHIHHHYLPLVFNPVRPCPFDAMVNGGFEQDDTGWTLRSDGTGHKAHDLIGSIDEGFSPFQGVFAAQLGAYEGVQDSIRQPVIIPYQGVLSYYWKMFSHEPDPINYDDFFVYLLNPDGTYLDILAWHDNLDPEDVWMQDVFDLSAYAGQPVILVFYSYNDNNFDTKFDIDEVRLCGQGD